MNVDPSGITRDRSWRGGACGRSRAARAAASARSNMMACDETRGPLFTGRGRIAEFGWCHATCKPLRGHGIWMASWNPSRPPGRREGMAGLVLQAAQRGGGRSWGVWSSKPPSGAAGVYGGPGCPSRPPGRREGMAGLVLQAAQRGGGIIAGGDGSPGRFRRCWRGKSYAWTGALEGRPVTRSYG